MTTTVRPAITGTYPLSHSLGMRYTIGHSVVAEAAHRIRTQSAGTAAVDIETYGLGADARRIKCVTIAHTGEAVILDPRDEFQANLIRNTISDLDVLIFHNSPFDVPALVLNPARILRHLQVLVRARCQGEQPDLPHG